MKVKIQYHIIFFNQVISFQKVSYVNSFENSIIFYNNFIENIIAMKMAGSETIPVFP